MPGTKEGGKAAAATNLQKYGADFYKRIGSEGGKKGRGHKFAHGKLDPELAGAKGGALSRRGPNKVSDELRKRVEDEFGHLGVRRKPKEA